MNLFRSTVGDRHSYFFKLVEKYSNSSVLSMLDRHRFYTGDFMLTFIEKVSNTDKYGNKRALYRCDCGNIIEWNQTLVRNNHKKHCGCIPKPYKHASNFDDLTGQTFGNLKVLYLSDKRTRKRKDVYWWCECICGKLTEIQPYNIKKKHTKSCGCLRHKKSWNNKYLGDITGQFWSDVKCKARTRDIKVLISQKFAWELFLKQDKKCALTGLNIFLGKTKKDTSASLDRIDSKGDYTEDNVQWIDKRIQMMKWNLPESEFVYFCHLVTNFQGGENGRSI